MSNGNSEAGDSMLIEWDVPVEMDDGVVLRADVFRPKDLKRCPVLLTYGPYAKGLSFQDGYPSAWDRMAAEHPDVTAGSTNRYQCWEVVDPEKWVPDGYACVRVDSRGCGRSPGYVQPFSPRETQDFKQCIEWAGSQRWSNGRVGLNGVSYFGINQWQVASLQPRHLAAMCVWEGAADWYRDMTHHGGILSTFWSNWYDMQVKTVQHGLGERGRRSSVTGELICGPPTLTEAQLAANRCDFGAEILAHPLDGEYYRERSPRWDRIRVPLLTAANWGGQGLHLRGNFEGYLRAATTDKWLEVHGLEHWTEFYTDYGVAIQKRFFGHFLKGEDTGWAREPRVRLQIRHYDRYVERTEEDWPLPRTSWERLYLTADGTLTDSPPSANATLAFEAPGEGLAFRTPPMAKETEFTGPSSLHLTIASSTPDADIFAVLQLIDPDGNDRGFQGAIDPNTPVAQGWLRASQRALDPELSRPWRPYHRHDRREPLKPDVPVPLDIEIWPTSIVVPAGWRLGLLILGRDYESANATGQRLSNFKNDLKGCGPFLHNDEDDRPPEVFGGRTELQLGTVDPAYLLMPFIPARNDR
ncbi:MAG: CocE/NonD family hydrolase [Woeseia sp.]